MDKDDTEALAAYGRTTASLRDTTERSRALIADTVRLINSPMWRALRSDGPPADADRLPQGS
jgi:hypothetical protein